MRIITRTGCGNAAQSALVQGIDYPLLPYTTLNEALLDPLIVPFPPGVATAGSEVVADYDSELDTTSIKSQYYVIGNLGHRNTLVGSIWVTTPVPHRATDTGLYHMIPFAVREIYPSNNDLSQIEREKYRLRKIMEIDSKLYAAYYAKRLDTSSTSPDLLLTTVDNDTVSTSVFSPSINNLRPSQPDVGSTSGGSYLAVASTTPVVLTAGEIAEIISACTLLYGNPALALVTEIGIVQAVEKMVTAVYPMSGTQTPEAVPADTYYDIVGAQITNFICDNWPLGSLDTGFSFTLDLGITESLFGVEVGS